MEGLGQVGAQAPQQGQGQPQKQEAPKFTFEMAGLMNDEIVARIGQGLTKGGGLGKLEAPSLSNLDTGAMKAVAVGLVDPMEVMRDPGVSNAAKAKVQRMVQLT